MTVLTFFYPGQAGAVDEDTFLNAFEDAPHVKLFSSKDLEDQMKVIKETIGDDKKDWKQRTESVSIETRPINCQKVKNNFYSF